MRAPRMDQTAPPPPERQQDIINEVTAVFPPEHRAEAASFLRVIWTLGWMEGAKGAYEHVASKLSTD